VRSLLLVLALPLSVFAQTTVPMEFPDDAAPMTPEALRERIAGKVFKVVPADGNAWRLEYRANGFVYFNSRVVRDTGKWRVEGTQLCTDWQKLNGGGCGETRLKGDVVYLKRAANGEVIALTPE
jgi:hypothetical protein